MILEILLGLAVVAVIVLSYIVYNLNRKIDIYEAWLSRFRSDAEGTYKRLKMVDERNLFDKDDDVGFVFSELVRMMKEFDESIK